MVAILPLQVFEIVNVWSHDDPLEHLVIDRQYSLERRPAFGDGNEGATPEPENYTLPAVSACRPGAFCM